MAVLEVTDAGLGCLPRSIWQRSAEAQMKAGQLGDVAWRPRLRIEICVGVASASKIGEHRNPGHDNENAVAGVWPVIFEGVAQKGCCHGYEDDWHERIPPHAIWAHRLRLALPEYKDSAARDHVEQPLGKNC